MKKLLLVLLALPFIGFGQCISGDCVNGYGTYIYDDGTKYVGQWKNGLTHGQGTYTWANGDKYVGEWKDDMRNGQGTFTWADGTVIEGLWKKGDFIR